MLNAGQNMMEGLQEKITDEKDVIDAAELEETLSNLDTGEVIRGLENKLDEIKSLPGIVDAVKELVLNGSLEGNALDALHQLYTALTGKDIVDISKKDFSSVDKTDNYNQVYKEHIQTLVTGSGLVFEGRANGTDIGTAEIKATNGREYWVKLPEGKLTATSPDGIDIHPAGVSDVALNKIDDEDKKMFARISPKNADGELGLIIETAKENKAYREHLQYKKEADLFANSIADIENGYVEVTDQHFDGPVDIYMMPENDFATAVDKGLQESDGTYVKTQKKLEKHMDILDKYTTKIAEIDSDFDKKLAPVTEMDDLLVEAKNLAIQGDVTTSNTKRQEIIDYIAGKSIDLPENPSFDLLQQKLTAMRNDIETDRAVEKTQALTAIQKILQYGDVENFTIDVVEGAISDMKGDISAKQELYGAAHKEEILKQGNASLQVMFDENGTKSLAGQEEHTIPLKDGSEATFAGVVVDDGDMYVAIEGEQRVMYHKQDNNGNVYYTKEIKKIEKEAVNLGGESHKKEILKGNGESILEDEGDGDRELDKNLEDGKDDHEIGGEDKIRISTGIETVDNGTELVDELITDDIPELAGNADFTKQDVIDAINDIKSEDMKGYIMGTMNSTDPLKIQKIQEYLGFSKDASDWRMRADNKLGKATYEAIKNGGVTIVVDKPVFEEKISTKVVDKGTQLDKTTYKQRKVEVDDGYGGKKLEFVDIIPLVDEPTTVPQAIEGTTRGSLYKTTKVENVGGKDEVTIGDEVLKVSSGDGQWLLGVLRGLLRETSREFTNRGYKTPNGSGETLISKLEIGDGREDNYHKIKFIQKNGSELNDFLLIDHLDSVKEEGKKAGIDDMEMANISKNTAEVLANYFNDKVVSNELFA